MTSLSLVQLTRKRIGTGLAEALSSATTASVPATCALRSPWTRRRRPTAGGAGPLGAGAGRRWAEPPVCVSAYQGSRCSEPGCSAYQRSGEVQAGDLAGVQRVAGPGLGEVLCQDTDPRAHSNNREAPEDPAPYTSTAHPHQRVPASPNGQPRSASPGQGSPDPECDTPLALSGRLRNPLQVASRAGRVGCGFKGV